MFISAASGVNKRRARTGSLVEDYAVNLEKNTSVLRLVGRLCVVLGFSTALAACGGIVGPKTDAKDEAKPADAPATEDPLATAPADRNFEKLLALGPDGLALKIRSAFGLGLTNTVLGGREVDYVQVNGTLFTGAISPDPNVRIPKQLASVSYFLALNGLADVVAKNYAIKMATNTAAKKCNSLEDARLMVQVVYPPVSDGERDTIAQAIVDSCNAGIPETVRAIITSYAFALDTSI